MEYSNKEIIQGINEGRSEVLQFLYGEYFQMIKAFIMNNNGTEVEAEDVFQDTVIIMFEKIKSGKLKLSSSFKTYFYGICKNLWKQRLLVLQRINTKEQTEESWNTILGYEEYQEFEEEKLFQYHFNKLDKECQKVLSSFFDKTPYRKIARDLKLSPNYIKKLKFNCKEKLYRSIIKDPIYHELMELRIRNQLNNNSSSQTEDNSNPTKIQFPRNHENKKRNK